MENTISGLNFSAGFNFNVGSYSSNKANDRINYNAQTYEDIPDYNSDIDVKENAVQTDSNEEKSPVDWGKAVEKGNQKALIKSIVGMFSDAKSLKIHNLGDGWSSGVEGLSTFIVAMAAGEKWDEAFSSGMQTFTKQWSKKVVTKSLTDKAVQFFSSQAKLGPLKIPGAASKGAVEALDDLVKVDVFKIDSINVVGSTVANFGVIGVINIVWNLAWDFIEDGSIDKPGTAIYKGAVMTVFSIAGKFFGACFGGKITEAVFSMVGAWVAEVTVNCYKTEEGRACAGVAILVGAAVGCALASNPVGWVVGLCILAGAVIAGLIVWVAETIVVYFDDMKNWYVSTTAAIWDFVSDLAVDIWDAGCEFVSDAYEFVSDVVTIAWNGLKTGAEVVYDFACDTYEFVSDVATTAWNELKTGAEAVYDFACDTGEWIADQASAVWEAAGDAYEWAEEKVEAGVEAVGDFLSDTGDAIGDGAEYVYEEVKDFAVDAYEWITSW